MRSRGAVCMVHQTCFASSARYGGGNLALGDERNRTVMLDREARGAGRGVLADAPRPGRRSAGEDLAALGRREQPWRDRGDHLKALHREARVLILDKGQSHRGTHPAGGARDSSPPPARDVAPTGGRSSSSHTSCTRCSSSPTGSPCCAAGAWSRRSSAGSATPQGSGGADGRPRGRVRAGSEPQARSARWCWRPTTLRGDRGLPTERSLARGARRRDRRRRGRRGQRQRELAEALTGMRGLSSGGVSVGGVELRPGDPRDARVAHGASRSVPR